jgi:hypothetical protein
MGYPSPPITSIDTAAAGTPREAVVEESKLVYPDQNITDTT